MLAGIQSSVRSALAISGAVLLFGVGGHAMRSGDAYISHTGGQWAVGTSCVEKVVALDDGRFRQTALRDKRSGRELSGGRSAGEFSLTVGDGAVRLTGMSGGWTLVDSKEKKLSQGELQLDIALRRDSLEVTKSYLVYPGSSVIREWTAFRNVGTTPVRISNPGFLNVDVRPGQIGSVDLHWMTGGEFTSGSWLLHTEKLPAAKPRAFDSYDAPKAAHMPHPGDGTNSKILLNNRQIWPETGWQHSADENARSPFDITADVKPGDRLVFLVNARGNADADTTEFNPTIAYVDRVAGAGSTNAAGTGADGTQYKRVGDSSLVMSTGGSAEPAGPKADGEAHVGSLEYTNRQGENGWRYQCMKDGKLVDLAFDPVSGKWRTDGAWVGADNQLPGAGCDVARVWTAPTAGTVHVTGSVCNKGNWVFYDWLGAGPSGGSAIYAPWYALRDPKTGQGIIIAWDYFGHWSSSFAGEADGTIAASLAVAGYKKDLAPGESITSPMAFTAAFQGDLDDAGNIVLDWQYRYLWEYTRDAWFPATRMLGYWYKGNSALVGNEYTAPNAFRKAFGIVDLIRYVGGDVYHRDFGWWDRYGDYGGPDWRVVNDYLGKHNMGLLLYLPMYPVNPESRIARDHADLLFPAKTMFDVRRPEAVDFINKEIDSYVKRWGNFAWRTDCSPMTPLDGDDTPMLAQDQAYRAIMKGFVDRNPGCINQACNGGGRLSGYDYVRYATTVQLSDGLVGLRNNYYASLMLPPDKTNNMPDIWDPNAFDKATWHGLLCSDFDLTGDTRDPVKMEGLRQLIDIYHYLHSQGVVGRWARVFRPIVAGDDPVMYFQRMSRDLKRGIIITKHLAPNVPVNIRPRGLAAGRMYSVSFQEGSAKDGRRKGADLMKSGISLSKVHPGELIYLNLPMHPGIKLDQVAPTAPSGAAKQRGENMGYPGIELRWKPGRDNNWVSYYEILRDGKPIDKVAKGTYYFDHSAGADITAAYTVRTVDGAGNRSDAAVAAGPQAARCEVYDDASRAGIRFSEGWDRQRGLVSAYAGTIASSGRKGDSAEVTFTGKRVLWFSKLGENCGKASVSVDGAAPEVVDTFSADDIWGVCVYRKELTVGGKHTLRIEVLGEHCPPSTSTLVHIDGVRAEP